MRAMVVVACLALAGCTVLCPTVGVIRGRTQADVITDEHGCMHGADGTTLVPCRHPGPVLYARTIVENALVGFLIDGAVLTAVWATALYSTSDTAFRR